jgi:hypothetical protein
MTEGPGSSGASEPRRSKLTGVRSARDAVARACCAMVAAMGLTTCTRAPAADPPAVRAAPNATAAPAGAAPAPHGDHNPHHGGIVMMKGDDLHYEVVLDPAGRAHRVYFTDAVREDLPASVASDVMLTIRRGSRPEERVALQIDEAGESWVGSGQEVGSPSTTTVRLAFVIRHEPYWIDLPFSPPLDPK